MYQLGFNHLKLVLAAGVLFSFLSPTRADTPPSENSVTAPPSHAKIEPPATAKEIGARQEDALSPLLNAQGEITRKNRERLEAIEAAKAKGDTLLQALLELGARPASEETEVRDSERSQNQVPPQKQEDASFPRNYGKPKSFAERLSMTQTAALLRHEIFLIKVGLENAPPAGTSPAVDQLRQRLKELEADANALDSRLGTPKRRQQVLPPKSPFKP